MSRSLIRPIVQALHAYVPGEQPRIKGLIKLNTNENPYPPSPRVLREVRRAVDGRLRLYPNPTAQGLRERLAGFHGCSPENVIVGNGSDELLAMATRAFVEPGARIQWLVPSYSLYPVLAQMHGARGAGIPLEKDFSLPPLSRFRRDAALTFVTTPNAPSGRGYPTSELDGLCRKLRGVVVLDEAYVDFAPEHAMGLALRHPHVLVSRTFSKAYSLCFQRIGYFVGPRSLVAALDKIRDSYNVNGLGQVAALAALEDRAYYRRNFRRVITTRERLASRLSELGFSVYPSQTNFLLARPPRLPAREWLGRLRARKILVRWFDLPEIRDCLRITVGTDGEAEALVRAARNVLAR
ncbi:MAG TPA: histidinol-phosphate transaminase [Planctomycetota bacterium]|nr:histidinol-phosphate transaminase [Planctomycetota bacterium]